MSRVLDLAFPDDIAEEPGMTPSKNQVRLYDGRTGEMFERTVTVGYDALPEAAPLGR